MLRVVDNSGVGYVRCIKVLGVKKRSAKTGDILVVSIRRLWPRYKKILKKKRRVRRQFRIGFVCRALLIRGKHWICRKEGVFIRFDENVVILLTRKNVPYAKRFKGPILQELCTMYPNIGSISNFIL